MTTLNTYHENIIKPLSIFTILALFAVACQKINDPGVDESDFESKGSHKIGCTRVAVSGCDSLRNELQRQASVLCGTLPAPPASCIPQPTQYAYLCLDSVMADSIACDTILYTVSLQDQIIARAIAKMNTFNWGCANPRRSSYLYYWGFCNGRTRLMLRVQYKCCS